MEEIFYYRGLGNEFTQEGVEGVIEQATRQIRSAEEGKDLSGEALLPGENRMVISVATRCLLNAMQDASSALPQDKQPKISSEITGLLVKYLDTAKAYYDEIDKGLPKNSGRTLNWEIPSCFQQSTPLAMAA